MLYLKEIRKNTVEGQLSNNYCYNNTNKNTIYNYISMVQINMTYAFDQMSFTTKKTILKVKIHY